MADDYFHVDDDDRLVVEVHAQLGAGRAEVVGHQGAALSVRVAAPPSSPRANQSITHLFADAFGVPEASIEQVAGDASARKTFRVTGVEPSTAHLVVERLLAESGQRNPARRRR